MLQLIPLNPWMRFGLSNWLMLFAVPLSIGALGLRLMSGGQTARAIAKPVAEKLAALAGRKSVASSARTATRYRSKSATRKKAPARGKSRTGTRRARRSAV